MNNNNIPLFERRAMASMKRAQSIFQGRGLEYGDTWKDARFLTMKAVAKELGIEIKDELYNAFACAALCDLEYERMSGGYKDDSLIDGINYSAYLAELMQELTGRNE